MMLSSTPHVAPPHSTVQGATLAEWSARWWQWALAQPAATNPITDTTGADAGVGQSAKVFFLAGSFSGDPVVRDITLPTGSKVFFPLANAFFLETEPTDPPVDEQRRFIAENFIEPFDELYATVDGVPVRGDLFAHREISPQVMATLPADNLFADFGVEAGSYPLVSDGYWLMLNPLARGEHTITFGGSSPDDPSTPEVEGFSQDITYHINVVPKGQYRRNDSGGERPSDSGFSHRRIRGNAHEVLLDA